MHVRLRRLCSVTVLQVSRFQVGKWDENDLLPAPDALIGTTRGCCRATIDARKASRPGLVARGEGTPPAVWLTGHLVRPCRVSVARMTAALVGAGDIDLQIDQVAANAAAVLAAVGAAGRRRVQRGAGRLLAS